jgi:PHD/YefM family antitoxin component YafN of YafNO toxin-antitoxin module
MITESIKQLMETFTIEEFQEDFDNLLDRVENGESFIIKSECGDAIMMPYAEYYEASESIRCFCDHDDGC